MQWWGTGPRRWLAGWLVVSTVTGLSACSDDGGGGGRDAVAAGTLGEKESGCVLPVLLDRPRGWILEDNVVDVDEEMAESLASLLEPGPFTLACELKPATALGMARVYRGKARVKPASATTDIERFVLAYEEDAVDIEIERLTTPRGHEGVQVTYSKPDPLDVDVTVPERAFLVFGPEGSVLVHVGAWDAEEYDAMQPGYQLIQDSVRTP